MNQPLYFCIWCGGFWKLYFVNPNLAPRTQILIPFRTLPHLSMTLTHFLCSFFLFVTLNFNKITIEIDNFILFHWSNNTTELYYSSQHDNSYISILQFFFSCTWYPIVYVHVVLHLMLKTARAYWTSRTTMLIILWEKDLKIWRACCEAERVNFNAIRVFIH